MWWISLILGFIRFSPMVFGKTLFFGDNYSLLVPGRMYTAKWLGQGIIPLWNPEILGGISWVGDINQSILYPSTWLFFLFPPELAINLTVISHWLITLFGMYWLILKFHPQREWALIGSILWAFSTQMTINTNNIATLQSLAWLPWVVYFGLTITNRATTWIGFPLVVTAQLWGGYPQYVIFGVFISALFSYLFKAPSLSLGVWLKRWLFIGWVSVCLAAALLFPFVETIFQSTRTTQTTDQAVIGSIHPLNWIESIVPYFFDYPRGGVKWGPGWNGQPHTVIYLTWFGWLALTYLIASRKNRSIQNVIIFLTAGLTAIWAMGNYLPGFAQLYTHIPILNLGRYPAMLLILTNFLLCFQLGRLGPTLQIPKWDLKKFYYLALIFSLIFSLGLVGWEWQGESIWLWADKLLGNRFTHSAFHTLERDWLIVRVILVNIIINSLIFVIAIKLWNLGKIKLLAGLLGLEMIINTQAAWFWGKSEIYQPPASSHQGLIQAIDQLNSPQFRFLTRNMNQPYTDFSMYWEALSIRQPYSDSFIQTDELKHQSSLTRMKNGLTPNWNMIEGVPIINGYTTLLPLNLANTFSENENRINFLGRIEPGTDKANQWSVGYYLIDKNFAIEEDLTKFAVVYEDSDYQIRQIMTALPRYRWEDGSPAAITQLKETPNYIEFELTSPENQMLTIADRYDSNWEVRVDGQAESLMNCSEKRCLVALKGTHVYRMYYRPLLFYFGAGITLVTGAMLAAWSWYNKGKKYDD